jgi:pSer/pThr/pTyr-binding forkhead associated (FHA) protein
MAVGKAMEVKLVCVGGKHAGQQVPISGPKFLIGRAEACHLRPGSELVSLYHAVILVGEGSVAVRDFASKNGTYVNGQRIEAERRLKTGEHLSIGPLEFEVRVAAGAGGKKKPNVRSVQQAAVRSPEAGRSSAGEDLDISGWLGRPRPSHLVQPRAPSPA